MQWNLTSATEKELVSLFANHIVLCDHFKFHSQINLYTIVFYFKYVYFQNQ